ncbi:MAG: GNAT family N-acetyltransferase [Rhodobacteraceae bacterium]|nr:GNAT family N-acetyltransferase [Paracoccaceae bacterium]MAY46322.1 GNAT family N-acetyltransferase [Paracoccaceae bacterium]
MQPAITDPQTRHARPEEAPRLASRLAPRLAALHVEVWRETYAGFAPAEALEILDEARRLPYWQACLGAPDPLTGAIVAVSGDDVLGVASFGPSTQPEMGGAVEIKHLYVRGPARGAGVGRLLLTACFAYFQQLGVHAVALAVVRENHRARRFYAAMGGVEGVGYTDPGPLWRSSNIVVRWDLAGGDG